jgi:hypothetical protein
MLNADAMAAHRLQMLGLASGTVKALRAGLEVMKRKRVGRIQDWNPAQSFAALGIMVTVRTEGSAGARQPRSHQRVPFPADDCPRRPGAPAFKRSLKGRGPCLTLPRVVTAPGLSIRDP